MLYAFDSSSNSSTPVWSRDLAAAVGGTAVSCSLFPNWPLCLNKPSGQHIVGPTIGVTGTPVIDTSASPKTLYVAEAADVSGTIGYYLLAVDITTGNVLGTGIQIAGSVPGLAPSKCGTSSALTGQTIKFDNNHIQRSGLLLLNGKVYVAFAAGPGDEVENGWLFAYSFTSNTFSQTAAFSTTPDGTGGGIWMSGAGPASDGNSIFVTTGNGTFDLNGSSPLDDDAGDSLLKLTPALVRSDYYTPSDVFSYNNNQGRCVNDIDFGSGGVLLPTNFTYTGSNGGCSSG